MLKNTQHTLELLIAIREQEYRNLEPCVIAELDEAILLLKNGEEKARHNKAILFILGKILDKLPQIIALAKILTG